MKIKKAHLNHLRKEINRFLEDNPSIVSSYEHGNFPRSDKVKDLQKRFCFDFIYRQPIYSFVIETLYKYMNDEHLYTALKAVCPTVVRRY